MREKLGFAAHYKMINNKDGDNLTLTYAENFAFLSSVVLTLVVIVLRRVRRNPPVCISNSNFRIQV